jgi:hypothetical protein
MSCALNINLWWDEQPDFFQKLAAAIICLPIDEVTSLTVKTRDREFDTKGLSKESQIHFGKVSARVSNGTIRALADSDIALDQIKTAIDKLRMFDLNSVWIEADLSFPIPTYDPVFDSLQDEPISVSVMLNCTVSLQRTGYEEQGQIRISFHHVGRFRSPENQYPYLFNKMPSSNESPDDVRRRLEIAAQVRQNHCIIRKIAEELIDGVGPDHLVVSDEFRPDAAFINYNRISGVYEIAESI